MSDTLDVLPHLRLQLNINKPDGDECYAEGYQSSLKNIDETENPYKQGSSEFQFWEDGWWAGFYGEEAAFELAIEAPGVEIQSIQGQLTQSPTVSYAPATAVNDTIWTHENIKKWLIRIVKLTGFIAVVVAAYEISDLAA